MDYQRSIRIGITAILLSLLVRLILSQPFPLQLDTENTETGPEARFSLSIPAFFPSFVETPRPSLPLPTEPPIPSYSDADKVELYYAAKADPDVSALLRKPLEWNLFSEEPSVLILHTHATESYTKQDETYRESSPWRTEDTDYNMVAIGAQVARELEDAGITVIHDRTLHDRPSYDDAYVASRKAVQAHLEQHPSIQLVLDIHRDAAERSYGQFRTKVMIGNTRCAQLMLVLGTKHEGYEENLSIGLKLHAQLERQIPGIARPLQLRQSRFNQDLGPGCLIVEVGAAGNTHSEARLAASQLSAAIITLGRGTAD